MRWPWWVKPGEDSDIEHGGPGPVLDEHGEPILAADGKALERVRVVLRRDGMGDPTEEAWVDPRLACQWADTSWR